MLLQGYINYPRIVLIPLISRVEPQHPKIAGQLAQVRGQNETCATQGPGMQASERTDIQEFKRGIDGNPFTAP